MDKMFNRILWNNDKLLSLKAKYRLKEHRCYNKESPYIYELFSIPMSPVCFRTTRSGMVNFRDLTVTATYKPSTGFYFVNCYENRIYLRRIIRSIRQIFVDDKKFATLDEMLDYLLLSVADLPI